MLQDYFSLFHKKKNTIQEGPHYLFILHEFCPFPHQRPSNCVKIMAINTMV